MTHAAPLLMSNPHCTTETTSPKAPLSSSDEISKEGSIPEADKEKAGKAGLDGERTGNGLKDDVKDAVLPLKVDIVSRDEMEVDASSSESKSLSSESSSNSTDTTVQTSASSTSKDSSSSPDGDSPAVKDAPPPAPKPTVTVHSPIKSTTTFPFSSSPSTSTSETMSSVIEVHPNSEPASTNSPASNRTGGDIPAEVSPEATSPSRESSPSDLPSPGAPAYQRSPSTSPSAPLARNFGHPFSLDRYRVGNNNNLSQPKKEGVAAQKGESAVSSLQAKRNKFLNRGSRADDDDSSASNVRSFKNLVSGSKFAALREKFMASNGGGGGGGESSGEGKAKSPVISSTPKSSWQPQSPSASSSSLSGGMEDEDSLNASSEQKKSIYGTPPTTPSTPLPYKTPPESPIPVASSTPTGELKSPTSLSAAQLKRQFLYGADHSNDGDVFEAEDGSKEKSPTLRTVAMAPIENIEDESTLEKMLEEATEFDERKKIRARLREVRKKKRDEREQKIHEQEKQFEEKMHKLEVESAQQRMKAVGLNVITPGQEKTQTTTKTSEDGKTKTLVQTTVRDTGSSKSMQTTILSKTEDTGFKSQSMAQESRSVTVGPGGSSSVSMSKTVQQSSSSSTTTTGPKGRLSISAESAKTKFDEEMEKKKKEREEKRKQDEIKFKEQQMLRKKQEYERKKKQEEEAKNRKAALMNKFGGSGGGGGGGGGGGAGGGGGMRVNNAQTIKQKLLEWAQKVTRGYPGVNVTNFSSSWANGLAFCAVIHHFYPDSFDFNTLDPKQRRRNFDLAFNTAESEADIMPLLDTDDMIMMKNNPDWKCVFTYVQSLYRHLNKLHPS
ncbi:uncharacterized protein [Diadema antillarum]|uniref:uncharacterized protein n=1 Tax=Diadema antillarum TaxID=105358 RepID=UPI003A84F9B7